MTEHPYPMTYRDPPDCREAGCPSFPVWEAYTQGATGEAFHDFTCGRHLPRFLVDWVSSEGSWVTLTRRLPNA